MRFLQDTLRKYTACRVTAIIPGLSNRTVTLEAHDNTLQQVLQMAFPDILLRDSIYYQGDECMIAIYADPAAETPLMPVCTVKYPRRPRGLFSLTFPNGFQRLPILSAPSSFAAMDRPSLHRIVSPDITRHFAGVTSGVLLGADNPMNLSIHGRSTIVSANSPLLVWDNFAYFGHVGDINPYDIDSVTVLKDAASAAIWGSFSSNTVIVLTSVEGKYRQRPQVTLDLNTTVTQKP
ncbi:MAG TPA: TonB-dependent receptor plug domain-containing protein, partial [Puia sp.]